ncbi:hypothetical protein Hanom_Chr02g00103621 [Helianthus anomalus]
MTMIQVMVFYLETLFMAWCFKHLLFKSRCFIWKHCSWRGVLNIYDSRHGVLYGIQKTLYWNLKMMKRRYEQYTIKRCCD